MLQCGANVERLEPSSANQYIHSGYLKQEVSLEWSKTYFTVANSPRDTTHFALFYARILPQSIYTLFRITTNYYDISNPFLITSNLIVHRFNFNTGTENHTITNELNNSRKKLTFQLFIYLVSIEIFKIQLLLFLIPSLYTFENWL